MTGVPFTVGVIVWVPPSPTYGNVGMPVVLDAVMALVPDDGVSKTTRPGSPEL